MQLSSKFVIVFKIANRQLIPLIKVKTYCIWAE